MIKKLLSFLLLIGYSVFASEHGIYLLTVKNHPGEIKLITNQVTSKLTEAGFKVSSVSDVSVPDLVREDASDHCSSSSKLIVFSSSEYIEFITSYGNKYIVAAFLKASVYTTPGGLFINISDPETINRIVFNDLYENGNEDKYKEVIAKTKIFKSKIIKTLQSIAGGEKVEIAQEPIRSDEDLMESSKDMFMMVGPMTFFNDEDQFEEIYSTDASQMSLGQVKKMLLENLKKFKPDAEDIKYRYTKSNDILKWSVLCETYSTDSSAFILGITRPRTEALSFHIAGASRETDQNKCPGIDHTAAYPIEVLVIREKGKIKIYTAREMFRMDMYFWDAGMMAFMDHMDMPSILDNSLRRALLDSKYNK